MKQLILFLWFLIGVISLGLAQQVDSLVLKINPENKYQTIDHFGASDAWSIQFVGNWPEVKRNAIADLLFSVESENDKPKGIGLSMWRFNLGAGSAEQGDASGIKDEWRRAPSFLKEEGKVELSNSSAQLWFANAAKERGVEKLLLFSNSPPVNFTKNGKAFSSDGKSNLAPEKEEEFASYVSQVILKMKEIGLNPGYFSPVNEPQWDWKDGGQEGNPYTNEEIASLIRTINRSFVEHQFSVKIDVAEAGKINYLYEKADKPLRGSQIDDFFNSESPNYLGDLPHVSKVISAHSYFTTSPFQASEEMREKLDSKINQYEGLSYWMSEYCILGGNAGEINGGGKDLGMESALYIARVIHQDLTVSNASAWNWWLAVSPYNYKDGLIYIDKNNEDGQFYTSKMLWTLGNFSRFIRPGFQRVEVESSFKEGNEVFASAYQDPKDETITIVLVNTSENEVIVSLDEKNLYQFDSIGFLTNESSDLAPNAIREASFHLPKNSVFTVSLQNKTAHQN